MAEEKQVTPAALFRPVRVPSNAYNRSQMLLQAFPRS